MIALEVLVERIGIVERKLDQALKMIERMALANANPIQIKGKSFVSHADMGGAYLKTTLSKENYALLRSRKRTSSVVELKKSVIRELTGRGLAPTTIAGLMNKHKSSIYQHISLDKGKRKAKA